MKPVTWIVGGTALLALLGFAWNVVRIGDDAERQLMAVKYLDVACTAYIDQCHDWPRSWEDLQRVQPTVGQVTLPRDRSWVEQQVTIDFHADLKALARPGSATFTGFGPTRQAYYYYGHQDVIDAARKAIKDATIEAQPQTRP